MANLFAVQAAIIAHYLGEWRPGDDAVAALRGGIEAVRLQYCKPDFNWALSKAELSASGKFGMSHSVERLNAAFDGIGEHRETLARQFLDVLSWSDEIGDPLLAGVARHFLDSSLAN